MKIAFLSPTWPDGANGIVTYLRSLSEALTKAGHQVFMLTFYATRPDTTYETIVLPEPSVKLPMRLARSLLPKRAAERLAWQDTARPIAAALTQIRKTHGLDVVEMEESFGWCGLIARWTDIPVVTRLHGPYFLNGVFEGRTDLLSHQLEREGWGIRTSAFVTSPSQQVLDATWQYYGLTEGGRVIPNPVAVSPPQERWSLASSDPHSILFVGRTDNRKGGDLVLKVFERIVRTHPQAVLHFVGPDRGFADGPPGASWQQYLEAMVSAEARARIVYHGELNRTQIEQLRRKCRMTLVFSRYETFGIVCIEALAQGCPLIATNVGGIPEIVDHERTGLLARSEDLDDLSEKVRALLDDSALAARLAEAGWEYCRNKYDPSVVAAQTVEAYGAAMQQHSRGGRH